MNPIIDKFSKYGAESLTDKEMLTTIIGQIEAEGLFNYYSDLATISRQSWKQIAYETDVTTQQARHLDLCMHLARRVAEAKVDYSVAIDSPSAAAGFLIPKLSHLPHEIFVVVFLNNAKRIKGYEKISRGGKNGYYR
jgi:DNA repair protein RadC